jgi:hypothetical protein
MADGMARLVLLHDHYDIDHMAVVMAEMVDLGAPELRGVMCDDGIYLLEGCHRARAAAALGLTITVVPVSYDVARDGHSTLAELVGSDCDTYARYVVGQYRGEDCEIECDVEFADEMEPYTVTSK